MFGQTPWVSSATQRLLFFVAWGWVGVLPAQFIAFNEHSGGANTHSNTTLYTTRPPGVTNAGLLKNVATGLATPVTLTVTNSSGLSSGVVSGVPNAGSPAAEVFGGWVTFGNGYLQLGGTQVVAHVLSGLNPANFYSLKGTAIKGNPAYFDRWTLFELAGALSFTNAHSAGILTNGRPGVSLANNQVALCAGENREGDLFDWEGVRPEPTGTVVIYSRRFLGASVPGVFTNNLGTPSYALEALRVEESDSGACSPPSVVTRPQDVTLWPGETGAFGVTAGGSPPFRYQWFRGLDSASVIPEATNAVYSIPNATATDAGPYRVQVSNACGFTSVVANLTLAHFATPDALDAQADGTLWCCAVQGDGRILLGGDFTFLAGRPSRYLGRLNPDGSLDSAFTVGADRPSVLSLTVELDGGILVAGGFSVLAGQACDRIGRLHPDGTFDPSFAPGADDTVQAVVVQPDGRILVGGSFLILGGLPRSRLGRLHPDGRVDGDFDPGADGPVHSLAVQPDGKVLVGGGFTALGGQPRDRIGRLHPDGTLDTSFNPGADGTVQCLTLQADDQVLVGGDFTTLGGRGRSRIGRLRPDGSLDSSFIPGADDTVYSLAVQTDGAVLVAGAFAALGGQPRSRFGRLKADGSLDSVFAAALAETVYALSLQADGSILLSGSFTNLSGLARGRLGRLRNPDSPAQSLTWEGPTVTWLRGGSSPEVWRTTFEVSTNNGAGWMGLGPGTRVPGGWQFNGLPALPNTSVRARGFVAGGVGNASGWVVESRAGAPLLMAQPQSCLTNATADVVLWVAAEGTEPLSWQWRRDGVDLVEGLSGLGTRSNLLVIPTARVNDTGAYTVVVSNAFGWTVSLPAQVRVIDPLVVAQPGDQQVLARENAVFQVGVGGTPPLRYQWYREGLPLLDATEATLTLTNVQWSEDGSRFWVVAGNAAGAVTSAVAVLTLTAPAVALTRGPYIMMGHFTNQSTVVWRSGVPLDGWVDYGLSTAYGLTAGSSDPVLQHEVTLSGLEPGRTYYYRLRSGGDYLAKAQFRSGKRPGTPMRVAWTGDHQEGGGGALAKVIATCQPDLVLHTGDAVDTCDAARLDAEFFSVFAGVLRESPSYWTPGNHEWTDCGPCLEAFDLLPEDHQSYSIEYGDLQAIALNSPAPPAAEWLRSKLVSSGKPWRLAFSHYPMYSAAGGNGESWGATLRSIHLPLLEQFKVDVVIAGHNHYYWRSLPIHGINFLVVGSGGAPRYPLGDLPAYTAAASDTADAFAYADLEGDFMHIHALDATGAQIDETVLDRQCIFQLDGWLAPSASLVGSRPGGLPLYAAVAGRYLYLATAGATAYDHFLFLSRTPSSTLQSVGPIWRKSSSVMAFDAFLAGQGTGATHRWFDRNGAAFVNLRVARSATRYDKSGVLEGVLDLQALYGEIPPVLYLAAAPFATGPGGSLVAAQQWPAGNGNTTLEPEEFCAVATGPITLAAPPAGRLRLSGIGPGAPTSLELAGPPNTAYDLEASRDLVHWEPLLRGVTSATGQLQFTDPAAAPEGSRFYRARLVAP